MYKRYQLVLPSEPDIFLENDYEKIGLEHLDKIKKIYDDKISILDNSIGSNDILDASKIMEDWFPSFDSNIFISHSHIDEKNVIKLCGWLKFNFDINTFVDSKLWGYSNKLQKIIDKNYCYDDASNTYFYDKRNKSTSHVNMMLFSSLFKMINKTECLLFLNTENSIPMKKMIEGEKTLSPWIYSELSVSEVMQIIIPTRKLYEEKAYADSFGIESIAEDSNELHVKYDLGGILKGIKEIKMSNLNSWKNAKIHGAENSLDWLYDNVR